MTRDNIITKPEKIRLLKDYFGWDDEFIKKLMPRDIQAAYKIMVLETELIKENDQ